jgi:urea transporter
VSGESRLQTAKGCGIGLVVLAAAFIVPVLLLRGMVWVSVKALPWLDAASLLALFFCFIVERALSSISSSRYPRQSSFIPPFGRSGSHQL